LSSLSGTRFLPLLMCWMAEVCVGGADRLQPETLANLGTFGCHQTLVHWAQSGLLVNAAPAQMSQVSNRAKSLCIDLR